MALSEAAKEALRQSARRGTLAAGTNKYYIRKRPEQDVPSFCELYKPSRMTRERADGLMVTKGDAPWDPPRIHLGLNYLLGQCAYGRTTVSRRNTGRGGDCAHRHFRNGVADADGERHIVLRALAQYGCTAGAWQWPCSRPTPDEAEAQVDDDWERLASAMNAGELPDCVVAVLCKGPYGPGTDTVNLKGPRMGPNPVALSEEYVFQVVTADWRDKEAHDDLHWLLRSEELGLQSQRHRWLHYYNLAAQMLHIRLPIYFGPPSGGRPLDHAEWLRWAAPSNNAPLSPSGWLGYGDPHDRPGWGSGASPSSHRP
eukprot:TRINITY_DN70410_c0_g1_i1.p1 TRINITY_DN70410_c0_g1~~TRINITY_DN70410_c0_g1_i1.p1  ORF type:complete len:338 (+),score=78.28 TRINITY_DN70410_c0_g1_i1:77-1015(+)